MIELPKERIIDSTPGAPQVLLFVSRETVGTLIGETVLLTGMAIGRRHYEDERRDPRAV